VSEHELSHGAAKVKAVLGKRVGPLPVGVWMLALGGGLGIAYYIRARSTATDAGTGDTTSGTEDGSQGGNTATNPGAGNLADLPDASSSTTDDANAQWQSDTEDAIDQLAQQLAALSASGVGASGTTATEINNGGSAAPLHPHVKAAKHAATNAAWADAVLKYAKGHGYDQTAATNAVHHYLNGGNLNARQEAILVQLVGKTSVPPQLPKRKATAVHGGSQHPGAPKKQSVIVKVVKTVNTKGKTLSVKKTEKAKAKPAKKKKK
jgi:hypothetical protein